MVSVCIQSNTGVRPVTGHIQNLGSTGNGTAAQTTTVLSPAAKTVKVGNTIVVGWGAYYDVTPSGVTDNLGNVYTLVEHRFYGRGAVLYSAPVTVAGAITTITVSHPSTQYVAMMAAEFGNIVALSAVGGGLNAASGTTATWVDSKSFTRRSIAIGWVLVSTATTETAGAASGSPSTPIALSAWFNGGGNISGSLCYAIAGASDVTAFSGTHDPRLGGEHRLSWCGWIVRCRVGAPDPASGLRQPRHRHRGGHRQRPHRGRTYGGELMRQKGSNWMAGNNRRTYLARRR